MMTNPPCPECKTILDLVEGHHDEEDVWWCKECGYHRSLGEFEMTCPECGGDMRCKCGLSDNERDGSILLINVDVILLNPEDHKHCFPSEDGVPDAL